MPGYRTYFMDSKDHIAHHEQFLAESDAEALGVARKLFSATDYAAFELWQERRHIHRETRGD